MDGIKTDRAHQIVGLRQAELVGGALAVIAPEAEGEVRGRQDDQACRQQAHAIAPARRAWWLLRAAITPRKGRRWAEAESRSAAPAPPGSAAAPTRDSQTKRARGVCQRAAAAARQREAGDRRHWRTARPSRWCPDKEASCGVAKIGTRRMTMPQARPRRCAATKARRPEQQDGKKQEQAGARHKRVRTGPKARP